MNMKQSVCISKRVGYVALFLTLLLSVIFFLSSQANTQKRLSSKAAPNSILGGTDVRYGEFPYTTYVTWHVADNLSCTGVAIGPRWVLTAAHCVNTHGKNSMGVSVNIVNREDKCSTYVPVRTVFMHPLYDKPNINDNDLALLQLERPLSLGTFPLLPKVNEDENQYTIRTKQTMVGWGCNNIPPTPTPSSEELWKICPQYKTMQECDMSGKPSGCGYLIGCGLCLPWGKSDINYSDKPLNCTVLKLKANRSKPYVTPTPYDPRTTAQYPDTLQKIDTEVTTTKTGNTSDEFNTVEYFPYYGSCYGDSGGPIYGYKDGRVVLTGIMSNSQSHMKVLPYVSWIQETMNNNVPPTPRAPSPLPSPMDKEKLKKCNAFTTRQTCESSGNGSECVFNSLCLTCVPKDADLLYTYFRCDICNYIKEQVRKL